MSEDTMFGLINWNWIKARLGLGTIAQDTKEIRSTQVRMGEALIAQTVKITSLEKMIMAKLAEVFSAIESTGVKIIATVNQESAEIVTALEAAKAGASEADLDAIIAKVNGLGSTVGDAVSGLIPTVETPVEPTPDPEPVPTPEPAPLPLPDIEVPVVVEPTEPEVGVDGGMSIEPAAE